jgi:outer membrane lipoprotein-sorting protein
VDENTRTRTLTRIAEEAVPNSVDLWPAIRTQVAGAVQTQPTQTVQAPAAPGRRRALLGGIASAAVLVLAPAGLITWWSQPAAVNAETILDRAQATAINPAAITTYHLKMTQLRGGTMVDAEVWYGGSTKQRSIYRRAVESGGAVVPVSESIFNGEHAWIILIENGRTRAVHTIGTDWNKPGGDPTRPNSLTDVLARYTSEKSCLNARQDGEAIIAGRPAYQIVATPKPEGCGTSPKGGPDDEKARADDQKRSMIGELRVWVDKQSFLLLKSETRNSSGGLIERGEVTTIEYNVSIPDSTFTYTPPPGVQVREFTGAPADVVKRALVEGDGKEGAPPPKRP